jgi:hypothetical protein
LLQATLAGNPAITKASGKKWDREKNMRKIGYNHPHDGVFIPHEISLFLT